MSHFSRFELPHAAPRRESITLSIALYLVAIWSSRVRRAAETGRGAATPVGMAARATRPELGNEALNCALRTRHFARFCIGRAWKHVAFGQ